MNILINPENGQITGIIDWAEMRVLPFGLALWGLENIPGYMDSAGWHYYDNHQELRDLFWGTFERHANDHSPRHAELVKVARLVGIFCRYGFTTEDGVVFQVATESDLSLYAYLDAFCFN